MLFNTHTLTHRHTHTHTHTQPHPHTHTHTQADTNTHTHTHTHTHNPTHTPTCGGACGDGRELKCRLFTQSMRMFVHNNTVKLKRVSSMIVLAKLSEMWRLA